MLALRSALMRELRSDGKVRSASMPELRSDGEVAVATGAGGGLGRIDSLVEAVVNDLGTGISHKTTPNFLVGVPLAMQPSPPGSH